MKTRQQHVVATRRRSGYTALSLKPMYSTNKSTSTTTPKNKAAKKQQCNRRGDNTNTAEASGVTSQDDEQHNDDIEDDDMPPSSSSAAAENKKEQTQMDEAATAEMFDILEEHVSSMQNQVCMMEDRCDASEHLIGEHTYSVAHHIAGIQSDNIARAQDIEEHMQVLRESCDTSHEAIGGVWVDLARVRREYSDDMLQVVGNMDNEKFQPMEERLHSMEQTLKSLSETVNIIAQVVAGFIPGTSTTTGPPAVAAAAEETVIKAEPPFYHSPAERAEASRKRRHADADWDMDMDAAMDDDGVCVVGVCREKAGGGGVVQVGGGADHAAQLLFSMRRNGGCGGD